MTQEIHRKRVNQFSKQAVAEHADVIDVIKTNLHSLLE